MVTFVFIGDNDLVTRAEAIVTKSAAIIQANVALVSISCFYLISIPVASYLAFAADQGIRGLWVGYFIGIIV